MPSRVGSERCIRARSLASVCVVTNALRLNGFDPPNAAHEAPSRRKRDAPQPEICTEKRDLPTEETAMKKTLHIEGMMCSHCEATVKKALEALDNVQSAEVSHETGTAVVTLTADVPDAALTDAVQAKDYTVTGIDG